MKVVAKGNGSAAVVSEGMVQLTSHGVTLNGPPGCTMEAHSGKFFIDGKTVVAKVHVNGILMGFTSTTVSYEDILSLEGLTGYPSMTYRHAAGEKEGCLIAGQSIDVQPEGSLINAIHTGNA